LLAIEGVLKIALKVLVEVAISDVSGDVHVEEFIQVFEIDTGTLDAIVVSDIDDSKTVDDWWKATEGACCVDSKTRG
jgi:hypothetical protein